jgi:non-specific serine/threonine protein kinase
VTSLEPGSLFAGYRIEGLLDRGGMGVVYRAADPDLDRTVALKIIAPEHTRNEDAVARFKAEARLAASLEHPNIVPIHRGGEFEGVLYLAMRFVPGTNLRQLIDSGGPLDMDRIQRVTASVAAALDAAHERGLVHRDVKPANILISGEGGREQVYLTDFGLTKRLGSQSSLTRTGAWVGTPDYVAPEQIRAETVDGRADVYSLGCVLYEMLTGSVAFPKDNDVAKLWAHVTDPPPAPSSTRPDLVKAFDVVVARATAKDPAGRYPRASELAAAVDRASAEQRSRPELGGLQATRAAAGEHDVFLAEPTHPPAQPAASHDAPETVAPPPPPTGGPAEPPASVPATDSHVSGERLRATEDGGHGGTGDSGAPPAVAEPPPAADATAGVRAPIRDGRNRRVLFGLGVLGLALVVAAVVLLTGGGDDGDQATPPASAVAATKLPANLDWRPIADPRFRRQYAAATAVGDKLWVFGGIGVKSSSTTSKVYDPAADTWRTGPGLPVALHHFMAVTYEGEAVVMGGFVPGEELTSEQSDRVYALRGDSWEQLPPLNHPRAAGAAAVVGDKIVVVGGQADGKLVRQTEVFDGERWTDVADMPTPREHLGAASDGRYLYAVGGRELSADKNLPTLERYDPAGDSWTELKDMPKADGSLGAAYAGGRVVTVGGEGTTSISDDVFGYDIRKQAWSQLPALPSARHGAAVAALKDSIYTIGGAAIAGHARSTQSAEVLDIR